MTSLSKVIWHQW